MGGSSQQQTTQSQTQPWAAAMPTINSLMSTLNPLIGNSGINPTEQGAINQLTANGQAGNPYAPAIGNAASTLLNGGGATSQNPALQNNLNNFDTGMSTYTNPNYSTLNTPAVQNALQQVATDTTDNINSQFAAAGRSGSGMNQQTLARGIAAAEAPIILNQANTDTATREAALNSVYGAGNTTANTLTTNNQLGNTNMQAGIPAASQALNANNWGPQQVLQAQQLEQSIPTQNLGALANIGLPLAQLGTTSNGTSTTQTDPSTLSMLTSLGGLFGSSGTSPIQGMANFGGQALGGLSSIFSMLPFA